MRLFIVLFFSLIATISFATETAKKPIPVTVKKLNQLLVERKLSATAQIVSVNHSAIASQNSAIVEEIHFDVGEKVEKGQVIIELDSTDYYLSLKQAQASLSSVQAQIKQAELRLKRAEELIGKKHISDDDLLARHTDLDVLKAEHRRVQILVEQANRELSKTKIKAPFDAVITKRLATVGSLVSGGQILAELTQFNATEIVADIPQHLSDTLSQASQIQFVSQNESFDISLKILSPVVLNPSRTQVARFLFANDFKAKIGSTGEVIWSQQESLLPADLVVRRNNKLGVFVINGNQARFVELKYAQEGRPVPMTMPDNTVVIVGGRERLQDGDSIQYQ